MYNIHNNETLYTKSKKFRQRKKIYIPKKIYILLGFSVFKTLQMLISIIEDFLSAQADVNGCQQIQRQYFSCFFSLP